MKVYANNQFVAEIEPKEYKGADGLLQVLILINTRLVFATMDQALNFINK